MKDQIIKTVKFSHKSSRARALFRRGIQVQKILMANPELNINLQGPHTCISQIAKTYDIPHLLARQLVLHPDLSPFYLIVPADQVHCLFKKSYNSEEGRIRIPYLGIDRPWVFGSNVHSVGAARANADTLFVDLVLSPDLRVSGSLPKSGRCRSRRKDNSLMVGTEWREIQRDRNLDLIRQKWHAPGTRAAAGDLLSNK